MRRRDVSGRSQDVSRSYRSVDRSELPASDRLHLVRGLRGTLPKTSSEPIFVVWFTVSTSTSIAIHTIESTHVSLVQTNPEERNSVREQTRGNHSSSTPISHPRALSTARCQPFQAFSRCSCDISGLNSVFPWVLTSSKVCGLEMSQPKRLRAFPARIAEPRAVDLLKMKTRSDTSQRGGDRCKDTHSRISGRMTLKPP